MRKIVQKKCSFNNEIKCQERHRMQDFAPFIPELLGATQGPQTIKGVELAAVRINLPATFQFSPATSKSIDIPDTYKQFQCNFTIAVTVNSTVPVVFFAFIFFTYLPESQI